jgi:hypothetical protein
VVGSVEVHRQLDTLVVTEAQPMIDYFLSSTKRDSVPPEKLDELRRIIEGEIAREGAVRIEKVTGLVIATRS